MRSRVGAVDFAGDRVATTTELELSVRGVSVLADRGAHERAAARSGRALEPAGPPATMRR
jgi:hypothetical protein